MLQTLWVELSLSLFRPLTPDDLLRLDHVYFSLLADTTPQPTLPYADSKAYLAAFSLFPILVPLLPRWPSIQLEDLATRNLFLHYFISVRAYLPQWPPRPDLVPTPPDLCESLSQILARRIYKQLSPLLKIPEPLAIKELVVDNHQLERLVTELQALIPNKPPSALDIAITNLTTQAEKITTESCDILQKYFLVMLVYALFSYNQRRLLYLSNVFPSSAVHRENTWRLLAC